MFKPGEITEEMLRAIIAEPAPRHRRVLDFVAIKAQDRGRREGLIVKGRQTGGRLHAESLEARLELDPNATSYRVDFEATPPTPEDLLEDLETMREEFRQRRGSPGWTLEEAADFIAYVDSQRSALNRAHALAALETLELLEEVAVGINAKLWPPEVLLVDVAATSLGAIPRADLLHGDAFPASPFPASPRPFEWMQDRGYKWRPSSRRDPFDDVDDLKRAHWERQEGQE